MWKEKSPPGNWDGEVLSGRWRNAEPLDAARLMGLTEPLSRVSAVSVLARTLTISSAALPSGCRPWASFALRVLHAELQARPVRRLSSARERGWHA